MFGAFGSLFIEGASLEGAGLDGWVYRGRVW